MRILLLSQFIPPTVGGTEQHVYTLATALAQRGHQITLLSFATHADDVPVSTVDGVRIVKVKPATSRMPFLHGDPSRPFALPVPDPVVRRAISLEIASGRFDVIHAHNWIVNSALGPAERAGIPVVMTLHEYSHICATVRLMENGATTCPGPSVRRCLPCATSHYGPIRGPITVAGNAWAAGRRAKALAHTVAVSGAVADAVTLDRSGWLSAASLHPQVIPNFIPDDLVLEDIPPIQPDAPLVFAGAIHPDKGVHTLLDAYRALTNPPALVLAGRSNGDLELSLPPDVQLVGPLPYPDVQNLFRSALAVIVPSVWPEPFGMVVLEAMAAGRPVVAAAAGGIVDVVQDGATGLLSKPGDASALAADIQKLIDNPSTAASLGLAGRDRARGFTVSVVVERIEQMYAHAIAKFEELSTVG
jgi:glycogen synthase